MDSPLCCQTVSIYRANARYVVEGCYYSCRYQGVEDIVGTRLQGGFTLITPADFAPRPGDRVMPGIGPDRADADAPRVRWVQPYYLAGSLHHFEAGN